MGEIQKQQSRLDKMDKVEDQKISVLGSEKEENLTQAYIKEVNDLMRLCHELGDENISRIARSEVLKGLAEIDETEELETEMLKFRSSVSHWSGRVRNRIKEKENLEKTQKRITDRFEETERQSDQMVTMEEQRKIETIKSIDAQIAELEEFQKSIGEEDEWIKTEIAYLMKGLIEIKKKIEKSDDIKDQAEAKTTIQTSQDFLKLQRLNERMYRGVTAVDELTKLALEQGGLNNITGKIEAKIKESKKLQKELTELQKSLANSKIHNIDIQADSIQFVEDQYIKPLEELRKSEPYLKARESLIEEIEKGEMSETQIKKHYRNIESLSLKNNPILSEDAEEILRNLRIELVGRATKSMEKEVERELIKAYGDDVGKYFEIKETETGKEYLLSKEVENLSPGEQLELQSILIKINQKLTLKAPSRA